MKQLRNDVNFCNYVFIYKNKLDYNYNQMEFDKNEIFVSF